VEGINMAINITYKIDIYTDWHCGSGLTSGADIDMLVIKDKDGFPFIPGKTLKGLLREAAIEIALLKGINPESDDFIISVFGLFDDTDIFESKVHSTSVCHFSNAELNKTLKEKSKHLTTHFYRKNASTAINDKGLADEHSLRKMETTIPLELFAKINGIPVKHIDRMIDCFKWIKQLGQNRHHGLGRCKFEIIEGGQK
jgi:CRISPR/Cas system CSM-associated protein Csm3 (group 7 of RAMP superfamily)